MKARINLILLLLLLFSGWAFGQNEPQFEDVARRLYNHSSYTSHEKIYVHQDRTSYVAGETMWLKFYQSSVGNRVNSGVVYAELTNDNNETLIETKWELNDGSGTGHIDLPDSLPRGVYQLRAYTRWMQNWYPEGYFTREITVSSLFTSELNVEGDFEVEGDRLNAALRFLNIPRGKITYHLLLDGKASRSFEITPDADGEVLLEIELSREKRGEGPHFFVINAGEAERRFPLSFLPPLQLTFFPEGGNLVAGLPCKVAFLATRKDGRGAENIRGIITDEEGNEVRRFETSHKGKGYFVFQPEAGKKYFASIVGSTERTALPEAYPHGIVMNTKAWEDHFRVTLQRNMSQKTIDYPLYLTVHQQGVAYFNARIGKDEQGGWEKAAFDIPLDKLPAGIFTVTIYDENNHAWCERLAFVNYPEQLTLGLATDRSKYGKRQKITLQLETAPGDFSLAVVKAGLDDAKNRDNFYSDYFLKSELRGYIEDPASYLTARDTLARNNLDLLLLTHGWRRYSWDERMSGNYPDLPFAAENGLTFSGRVHLAKNQKEENVMLTANFKHDSIDEAISFHPGRDGLFKFENYRFTDTAEVVLSATDHRKNALEISINEHLSFPARYYNYGRPISKAENDSLFIELKGDFYQGEARDIDKKIFELPEVSVTAKKKKKTYNRLHGEEFAHGIYEPNPKFSYGGRISTLLQFVSGVTVKDADELIVSVNAAIAPPGTSAVFVLNGMRTTREVMLSIPPARIERVEVVSGAAAMAYGSEAAWVGAVVFYTRPHGDDGLSTLTIAHKFPGYSQAKEFYSPDYSVEGKEYINTDHRNTLYWKPEVTIGEEGRAEMSFYTSEDKGEYLIHCEGRSTEGVIGVSHQTFTVE